MLSTECCRLLHSKHFITVLIDPQGKNSGFSGCVHGQFVTNAAKTKSEIHPLYQCKEYFSHDYQYLLHWSVNDLLHTPLTVRLRHKHTQLHIHTHTSWTSTAWLWPCFKLPLSDAITSLTVKGDTGFFLFQKPFVFPKHPLSLTVSVGSWQRHHDLGSHLDIAT